MLTNLYLEAFHFGIVYHSLKLLVSETVLISIAFIIFLIVKLFFELDENIASNCYSHVLLP